MLPRQATPVQGPNLSQRTRPGLAPADHPPGSLSGLGWAGPACAERGSACMRIDSHGRHCSHALGTRGAAGMFATGPGERRQAGWASVTEQWAGLGVTLGVVE
jgi:hypothetical protein